MDRISNDSSRNSSGVDRNAPPNLNSSSPKTIAELIAFIADADNKALQTINQTYFPVLEDAGADAILSFFYTVKDSFDLAVTSKKISLFALLSDCACKASGKIPDESRLQMILQLSQMTFIDSDDVQEMMTMAKSIGSIVQNLRDELNFLTQHTVAMNQSADDARYCAMLSDTLHTLRYVQDPLIDAIATTIKLQQAFPRF